MTIYIVMGTLAAIGGLCVLWACFGWLLPGLKGCALVCPGWPDEGFMRRYRWLRDLGLLNCPLLIAAEAQPEKPERYDGNGIEICSRDVLWQRLERERTDFDGTGNGDPPGRHQRGGISEL